MAISVAAVRLGDIEAGGAGGLMEALLGECCHIAASEDQMIRPDFLQRIRAANRGQFDA